MAISTLVSTKELQRQAQLCFEGKTINIMLCSVGTTGFTSESTVANWQSVEKTGNGYTRFTQVVPSGSYDSTLAAYVIPNIDAEFSCLTSSYSFDKVVIYFTGETYIHSLISEDPNIAMIPGQIVTYRISLRQDD